MPLTHDFKETIRNRAQSDLDFRQALLREAVECMINGDLETGKAVLRLRQCDRWISRPRKAYAHTSQELDAYARTEGSPSAANLSSILTALQTAEGVHFELSLIR